MPGARSDAEIADFFDRCARQNHMTGFPPDEAAKLKYFFSLWDIKPGARILEPGCGSGRFTVELAKAVGPDGEVYACDLSPEMIEYAKNRGLPRQVHFALETALSIGRPDNWFDYIICLNVFPHFSQPDEALNRFFRLLKPGGNLWINHFEGSKKLNNFHREFAPEVACHFLPDRKTMIPIVEKAGFSVEAFEDLDEFYLLKAKCKKLP